MTFRVTFGGVKRDATPQEEAEILAMNTTAAPPTSLGDYENAVQNVVDETAKSKSFRDGVTMASYANSTNLEWAAEAQAFIAWRDRVWMYVYEQYALVLSGSRDQPTVEELLDELDPPNWPA